MEKRKLTKEEIDISKKSIERLQHENAVMEYNRIKQQLELDIGIDLLYKEKMKISKETVKQCVEGIKMNKKQIDILNDQINEGVLPKRKPIGI